MLDPSSSFHLDTFSIFSVAIALPLFPEDESGCGVAELGTEAFKQTMKVISYQQLCLAFNFRKVPYFPPRSSASCVTGCSSSVDVFSFWPLQVREPRRILNPEVLLSLLDYRFLTFLQKLSNYVVFF